MFLIFFFAYVLAVLPPSQVCSRNTPTITIIQNATTPTWQTSALANAKLVGNDGGSTVVMANGQSLIVNGDTTKVAGGNFITNTGMYMTQGADGSVVTTEFKPKTSDGTGAQLIPYLRSTDTRQNAFLWSSSQLFIGGKVYALFFSDWSGSGTFIPRQTGIAVSSANGQPPFTSYANNALLDTLGPMSSVINGPWVYVFVTKACADPFLCEADALMRYPIKDLTVVPPVIHRSMQWYNDVTGWSQISNSTLGVAYASRMFIHCGAGQLTVVYAPAVQQWIMICAPVFSSEVYMSTSYLLQGPWSTRLLIHTVGVSSGQAILLPYFQNQFTKDNLLVFSICKINPSAGPDQVKLLLNTIPCAPATPVKGDATLNTASAQLIRLYLAFFLREPDCSGYNFWLARSPAKAADSFAASNEFVSKYGSLTNAEFVTLCYRNVLLRNPDSGGLTFWTNKLVAKTLTRGQVMSSGFAQSNEFINKKSTYVLDIMSRLTCCCT